MWHFRESQMDEIIRTSHEAEFFNMQQNLEAVIREAVQNSLDASDKDKGSVTVRFVFGRVHHGMSTLFLGMEEHLSEVGISTHELVNSGFEFLAIEDFGTVGLTGSTLKDADDAESGNFFNFWWLDGSTRKGMQQGGRWGIGKYSFFEASKVKSFWGISNTESGSSPKLMGRILLKPHKINNRRFTSDGIFASEDYQPIQDLSLINSFFTTFNLRRNNLPGFSLIIPHPVDSISKSLNLSEDILINVLEHYLFSIVEGRLKIIIETFNISPSHLGYSLEKGNIEDFLRSMSKKDERYRRYEKFFNLYQQLLTKEPDVILSFEMQQTLEVGDSSFGDDLNRMKERYDTLGRGLIKIRVKFDIQKKDESAENTYVDLGITRDTFFKKENTHCVRSGINVVDGISFRPNEGVVLLIVNDHVSAEFLGDSENPSHTQWSPKSERVREKSYLFPKKIIDFIKSLPASLVSVLSKKVEITERNILAEIFYINDSGGGIGRERNSPNPDINIERSKPIFQLAKISGGFTVFSTKELMDSAFPIRLYVKAAYDISTGSPFNHYNSFDFVFGENIKVDVIGGEILSTNNNKIEILVKVQNFRLSAEGFDPKRDLIINYKFKEVD